MARDIYDKTKNIQGDEQVQNMLAKFQEDHDRHIQQLEDRIRQLGGEPQSGAGIAGTMANLSAMYKSLLGPDALLKQVYEGEKMGVDAYDDRLDALDPESLALVRRIKEEDHKHLQFFEERINQEKSTLR